MDGQFYHDLKEPFMITPPGVVTLATTMKALHPVDNVPCNTDLMWWAGKTVMIRAFAQVTTGTTPGQFGCCILYGTGADANGVFLTGFPLVNMVASQTNKSFLFETVIRCISIGSTGTFFGTGLFRGPDVLAGVNEHVTPATAPAVSPACDLTVPTNVLSLQAKRSGSTGETMQLVDLQYIALN